MTPDFKEMAWPGGVCHDLESRAADMLDSRNLIECDFASCLYDQLDKHHFCGSPISPAGDRWDNRRKARRDGQHTLIV